MYDKTTELQSSEDVLLQIGFFVLFLLRAWFVICVNRHLDRHLEVPRGLWVLLLEVLGRSI
jgi:hypothetical protein